MRNALVIVQVALSLVLLTTAGLFLRSLGNASSIDIGFQSGNLLVMAVDPELHHYSREKTAQFLSQLRDRVRALPGVRSVSFVDNVPLSMTATTHGFESDVPGQTANANVDNVFSGYFQTMGIPFVRGRDFNLRSDSANVAIVNQTMASHLFASQDPVGRSMRSGNRLYTVIGVVRNSKLRFVGEDPINCVYLLLGAASEKDLSLFGISTLVKTSTSPHQLIRPVRDQIAALDPNMAVFNTETMREHVSKALLLPRISALLLGVFGAVGLTLATIGLFGVMSYSVRRRTREIGIRMALGARPGDVLRMVLRQGLALAGVGLAIGLGLSLALGRFTASLLYGISGTDPLTLCVVSAVLLGAATVAVVVPAFRAAHLEPTAALRVVD
jgi:predicted permease